VKNKSVKHEKITVIYSYFIPSNCFLLLEERCEPSFPLFRNTGTRRFCPDIHDWKDLDNYEIGDGFEVRDPISGDETNKNQYPDRNKYNTNNRNNDRRNRPTTAIPDLDIDSDLESID
jgi:hypothetical protein